MRKIGLLIIVILRLDVHSWSQLPEFSPNTLLSQATVKQWTGDNGLISNNITSSIQAKTGFIWITSYSGIMRFDGNRVDVFDQSNLPFLSTNSFYKVYEDREGILWFVTQGSGIVKYDGHKFSPIDSARTRLPKSIRSIYLDENDVIWVGSQNEGLYQMNRDSIYKVDCPLVNNFTVTDIVKDSHNTLWIGTEGGGVIKYDGTKFSQFTMADGLLSNRIYALSISKTDEILIGSDNGFNSIVDGEISPYDFLKQIPVNNMINDASGRIWVATENGLARIDAARKTCELASEKDGFPFARINNLTFDSEGSLWMSTGRSGLVQIKETGIINFTISQGLSINRTNIVVEGPDKTFYIGSDRGDLDVYKNGQLRKIKIKTPLSEAGIRDVFIETNGDLWVASYKGMLKISGQKEKLLTTADGLPANDFRRVLHDLHGNLWFASRSGGLVKYRNNKVIRVYDKNNGLASNYILALEEDAHGNLYVGTHSGGLTIIDTSGQSKTFHLTTDDAGILIFNVHIDKTKGAWLTCNIGTYYFDGEHFKKIKIESKTVGETYFDLLEDTDGNFWITSNVGVLKIEKNDLAKYKAGTIHSLPTKLYNNEDGMKNKECTGATRSIVSSAGKLWIPTLGGVSVFYPEKIKENKIIPSVYITSLLTDSVLNTRDSVEVQAGNLRYTFNYTALSYLAPTKAQFKYRLEGIDPAWQDVGVKRQAEYTNLPPGHYTFRVIACNNDGIWNEQGASVYLTVLPFFYQTYWFYAVSVIAILLIFYVTYKVRIHRMEARNAELRKLNSELDSFVYSTSHDLRAPLASVLGLVNLSRLEEKNKDQYLNLIEKSVKKLDRFINEIIDYSRNSRLDVNPMPIDFKSLITDIFEDLEYLEEKNHITTRVEVSGEYPLFSDLTRVSIILRNLISNSIKYYNQNNPSPELKITVNTNVSGATIHIRDNGIGIDESRQKDIFKMFYRGSDRSSGSGLGLYIVKESVEKLKGKISVRSKIGEGSTFEIILPSLPH